MLPEANGFMIVNREYTGMTPLGMEFSTLAGMVGGGHQTPGFLGVGRRYVISRKFITADGGLPRLVWMPKELREDLADGLAERAQELDMPTLPDQIATEDDAQAIDDLLGFLQQAEHPALQMDPLL
jgi:acetyl-CoA synthase